MIKKISLMDIALIGIATALVIGMQIALSFIPNIEFVTLLFILYTLHFKAKAIYIVYIFVLVECLIYPFGLWCIVYLYIWLILYFLVQIFKGQTSAVLWAIVGAIFGLLFGSLSSIPYFFTMGFAGGIAHIVSGLSFDLIHCFGNFVVILVLFKPLNRVLGQLPYFALQSPDHKIT